MTLGGYLKKKILFNNENNTIDSKIHEESEYESKNLKKFEETFLQKLFSRVLSKKSKILPIFF